MTAVYQIIASIFAKLISPVLAFFAGKWHEKKQEAEDDLQEQKDVADKLMEAHRIGDGVDNLSAADLERLREKLNNRP